MSPALTATRTAGSYPPTARAGAGIAGIVTFALTNMPSTPTSAVANGVGPQTATVNQPFALAPSVRVTDAYGNRVPGIFRDVYRSRGRRNRSLRGQWHCVHGEYRCDGYRHVAAGDRQLDRRRVERRLPQSPESSLQ